MEELIVTAECRKNLKVSVTIPADSTMEELADAFKTVAIGLGYDSTTVEEYIS